MEWFAAIRLVLNNDKTDYMKFLTTNNINRKVVLKYDENYLNGI